MRSKLRVAFQGARANGLLLYLATATSVLTLLALNFIVKHKAFAFVDVGSDPFVQFYPIQLAEARQLKELGQLSWSFDIGLGSYLGLMLDPIQLLSSVFPESWQLKLRLPIYMSELLLSGTAFLFFLRRVDFAPTLSVLGALAYTFCSYATVNDQWDPNALVPIQLAAYLFLLESFLRRPERRFAVFAGVCVGIGAPFEIYTFALFTCAYLCSRWYAKIGTQNVPVLLRFSFWAAMGIALTAPVLLPKLHYLFDNPRVSGDRSALLSVFAHAFQLNDSTILGSELAGFFGKDLLGTGDAYRGWANYFEGPGFYVGILLLLCIPQLFAPAASSRERKTCFAVIVVTTAYLVWPVLRYAVYGFGHIAFRLSTLWISIALIVTGLAGLRRILQDGPWRPGLIAGTAAIFGGLALILVYLPQIVNFTQVARVVAFTSVYFCVLWGSAQWPKKMLCTRVILPIFASELLLFAVPPIIDRAAVDADGHSKIGTYADGTAAALSILRQRDKTDEFYRIEKAYRSVFLCDSLAQDYAGIASYYFHGSALTRFVDHVGIDRPVANNASYIGSAVDMPAILDLVGVKYVLAAEHGLDNVPRYQRFFDAGGLTVYRNMNDLGFAHLHRTLLSETDADKLPLDERLTRMRNDIVVADPASVKHELDQMDAQLTNVTTSYAAVRRVSDIDLLGDVSSPRAVVLLVAMPYDPGWTARLDNTNVPTFVADYGLTGVLVPPGLHALHFTFRPSGRALGEWLALASLAVIVVPVFGRRLRRKRAFR